MSFGPVPSKAEVQSWDPHRLADFLRKRSLTGCDTVVTRYHINGQRFLKMTENDLQRFPQLHAPMISKICHKINKENKRIFPAMRPSQPVPSYPQPQVEHQEAKAWDSEEFSDENDYEDPDSNNEGEDSEGEYESPAEESDDDNGYEPTPTEHCVDIIPSKRMDNGDYIDNSHTRELARSQPPIPPERPGAGPALPPERPNAGLNMREERPKTLKKTTGKTLPPPVNRSTKPTTLVRSMQPSTSAGGRESSTLDSVVYPPRRPQAAEPAGDPMRIPKPSLPPGGVRRSASSVTPGYLQNRHLDQRLEFQDDTVRQSSNTFPLHARNPSPRPMGGHRQSNQTDSVKPSSSLPSKLQEATKDHHQRSGRAPLPQIEKGGNQVMDPAWYMGEISRSEAERYLRRVNRDGAFLVRDSSNRSYDQPYTLVVLFQDKVYNIQIRRNDKGFMLGTGLKVSESFERVSDIVNQHKHMPLLLIDAKNRVSSQQNQCALTYPAGN